jgi:hypothetical protein
MFELVDHPKDFRLNVTVIPTGKGRTGAGIIIRITDVPEKRREMLKCDNIYHVMTDFGNIIQLSLSELNSNYNAVCVDDPQERFERQKELLTDAEVALKAMGIFK